MKRLLYILGYKRGNDTWNWYEIIFDAIMVAVASMIIYIAYLLKDLL